MIAKAKVISMMTSVNDDLAEEVELILKISLINERVQTKKGGEKNETKTVPGSH